MHSETSMLVIAVLVKKTLTKFAHFFRQMLFIGTLLKLAPRKFVHSVQSTFVISVQSLKEFDAITTVCFGMIILPLGFSVSSYPTSFTSYCHLNFL